MCIIGALQCNIKDLGIRKSGVFEFILGLSFEVLGHVHRWVLLGSGCTDSGHLAP